MGTDDLLERVRAMYDGFTRSDFSGFLELVDEAVVWHLPGNSRYAGTTSSRDELVARMLQQAEASGGTTTLELIDSMADGEMVVVLERIRAEREGATLDVRAVVVYRFAGGRVVEAWDVFDDQAGYDAFWS